MREARFTPGPWIANGKDYRVRGDDGAPIADVLQWSHPLQQKFNAHLIAAAPEMYEALKAFVEAYEKSLQLEKTDVALRLAKAALSKAVPGEK